MTLSDVLEYIVIAFWLGGIIGLIFYSFVNFFRGKT